MADLKELATKRSALLWFHPKQLEVKPGLNARDFNDPANMEHVREVAASIAANGFYPDKPLSIFQERKAGLVGNDNHLYIADGECRWRAALMAMENGAPELLVACVQTPSGMNDVDLVLHRNLSNTGKRFTALEEGQNIKHAMAFGASIKTIAAKLGKSESHVSQLLELQAAPEEVHNAIRAGEISPTLAGQIVREEGKEAGKEIIKEAVAVAKKSGRKKATAKHVAPVRSARKATAPPVELDPGKVKIQDRGPTLMSITLGREETYSREFWQKIAHRILDHVGGSELRAAE